MLPRRFSSATTIYEVGSSSSTSIIAPAITVSKKKKKKKFSNAFNDDERSCSWALHLLLLFCFADSI
jgi:hypothetical protein